MAFPSNASNISTSATTHFIDRRPPPPQKKWVAFKKFFWNRQKHTFCGRSILSWLKILVFYIVFLSCVIGMAFFFIVFASNHIKQHCIDKPCIKKQDILFEASPGLSFEPNIIKHLSPLIWFVEDTQDKSTKKYVRHIESFLERFNRSNDHSKYSNCSSVKEPYKPCAFYIDDLGPCGKPSYGYDDNKPCIYIKLNKLPDWKPDFYTDGNLPSHMPYSLKNKIKETETKNVLWLYCEGMTPSDHEHLGSMSYFPLQGYRNYYFPFDSNKHYIAPIVAIKLNQVKSGYSISISCSIWAKNVNNKDPKEYSTYIQLYIEPNP